MEKYTVIVPTRDRAETLEATLRTCLRQNYENFEVIVSDNCSDDNTHDVVRSLNDPRIRYLNTGRRLSMTGNFEFALHHADDGFVMFIGSDDGLMPDAVNYVDSIVKEFNVEAVSCHQATYVWPDFPDKHLAGRLIFESLRSGVEIRKSSDWIKKALSFESHYCFDLPNLYCGFVHRRVIDKATKDGIYFRSITPDAYSAYASAIFLNRYAYSFRPFSIAGASVKSNGASGLNPKSDMSEAERFLKENDLPFASGFVNCPSYEVISAEAFSKLAETFPSECSDFKIDYNKMLEMALLTRNSKTSHDVVSGVAVMARNFSVDIESLTNNLQSPKSRLKIKRVLPVLKTLLLESDKIVEVENTGQFGIRNIDDAALFAHSLRLSRERNGLVTSRARYWRLIRQLFGLHGHKTQ